MNGIKEKTSNSSQSYLFVFNETNIIPAVDENQSNVIVFDDENSNNFITFNKENENDDFILDNRLTKNNFVFENERYGHQYFNKYKGKNSLFVLEGKNDYLYIGVFFLLIAFFLIGGFYF